MIWSKGYHSLDRGGCPPTHQDAPATSNFPKDLRLVTVLSTSAKTWDFPERFHDFAPFTLFWGKNQKANGPWTQRPSRRRFQWQHPPRHWQLCWLIILGDLQLETFCGRGSLVAAISAAFGNLLSEVAHRQSHTHKTNRSRQLCHSVSISVA